MTEQKVKDVINETGCIPANEICPFRNECEKCPRTNTDTQFSCGLARGLVL